MKRNVAVMACIIVVMATVPAHAFLNYLFGGDSSREAVENSALGDIRAWWTGNPVYQFNPFYSGQMPQAPQGQSPSSGYGQQSAPSMQYVPPQQAPPAQYGQYGQPMQQMQPQAYGPPMQQPMPMQQMQPQAYGPPPPYQGGPGYQGQGMPYGGGQQYEGGVQYYQ